LSEAILLTGGRGVGLEPITHTRPKSLIPVLDKPLIELHLRNLAEAGVKRVIIVISYMGDKVKDSVELINNELSLNVEYVDQGEPLGTAHALIKALPHVRGDEFLLIYGDVYYGRNPQLLKELITKRGTVITVAEVDSPSRYGALLLNGDKVVKIIEKPREFISNYVNAGVYKLTRGIERYAEGVGVSERGEYELTTALQAMINSGECIGYVSVKEWVDVGRPWSLIDVNKYELMSINKQVIKGAVEGNVVIKGPVIIEEGAQVLSGSYIIGPAYIGRDATVGPNAFIRPYTVILRGARIGFNVEVKESIVMEYAHISHQSYVGDSVVCEHTNLGAGTILANLRFDEKNVKVRIKGVLEDSGRKKLGAFIGGYVRTGVNVSTLPGVKIGAYSWIYPGVVVTEDVPPKSIVKYGGEVAQLI